MDDFAIALGPQVDASSGAVRARERRGNYSTGSISRVREVASAWRSHPFT
jgi:hypothetical protein